MRCFGRTKKFTRCKNNCSFILCRHHRFQWFGLISIIATLSTFYNGFLKPSTEYLNTFSQRDNFQKDCKKNTAFFQKKDSLTFNILITRFEDFKSDKNTYCIGRSIEEHLNVLKSNNSTSIPIEVIYNDSIFSPKNSYEARKLQRTHNADLVIYGTAKKISNYCGNAEVCFRYKFDNNILPKELSMFDVKTFSHTGNYVKTTSDNIEKGKAQVDALSMKEWVKSLVEIKSNKKETIVLNIAAIRNNTRNLTLEEKSKNFNSLGKMYYDSKQYDKAKQAFEESIKLYPTAEFYRDLGKTYRSLKKYKKSVSYFDKGLKLEPENDTIYNSKGISYLYMKKYDSALINYKKAFFINPKNKYVYNNIAKVYRVKKDYKSAITFYEKALKNNKKDKVSNFGLGLIYKDKKEFRKSIKYYSKSIEADSSYVKVYSYRGYTFLYLREYQKAINDLSKYIYFVKNDYIDYSNRASAYLGLGKYKLAIKDCKKALELNSKHTAPYYILGEVYCEQKENLKALEVYNQVIKLDSTETIFYKKRAKVYARLKMEDKALNDYNKVIEIDSVNAEAYALKSITLSRLNLFKRAIINYDKSVEIDTIYNKNIHIRANANFYIGNYNEAVKEIKKAINFYPRNLHYRFDLLYFLSWKYWFMSFFIIVLIIFFLIRKLMRI